MALQSQCSAMEGASANYEPMPAGRLAVSPGTSRSCGSSVNSVEPQISDPHLKAYPSLNGLEHVVMQFESLGRICEAMIKKLEAPDGLGTSQCQDPSQFNAEEDAGSTKNPAIAPRSKEERREKSVPPAGHIIDLTGEYGCDDIRISSTRRDQDPPEEAEKSMAVKNSSVGKGSAEKKRWKFVPVNVRVIDLTLSEDTSCDLSTSTSPGRELPEEAGEEQSPLASTGVTGICSYPVSPPSLTRQHPDPAEMQGGSHDVNGPLPEIFILSDDDDDDVVESRSQWEHCENYKAADVAVDDNTDGVADMCPPTCQADIKLDYIVSAGYEQEPTPPATPVVNNVKPHISDDKFAHICHRKFLPSPSFIYKRRKVKHDDDVLVNVGNGLPPTQRFEVVNEPMQVESPSLERPKTERIRLGKNPSSPKVEIHKSDHQEGMPKKPGKGDGIGGVQRNQKGREKAKDEAEKLMEDDVDEEKEDSDDCGKAEDLGNEHPPIQRFEAVNEPTPVESIPLQRPQRGRRRPGKNGPNSSKVEIHKSDHQEGMPGKTGKGDGSGGVQRDKKGKGKTKDEAEELMEDEVDEEEEEEEEKKDTGKAEDPGLTTEDLKKLSAKFNGEEVEYKPYVRKIYQLEEEGDFDDELNFLKTLEITSGQSPGDTSTTKSRPQGEVACCHPNFDFDEALGYYCGDCGACGIEMPTVSHFHQQNKICAHRNCVYTEEAGYHCFDCGKVLQDIESLYVYSERPSKGTLRKQTQKVQEEIDHLPQLQLTLQGCSGNDDFRGANLELHPFFEERLLPHQKKGFKFLTENLLGGGQQSNESKGCVLAYAPGTGKTCLVISFIHSFLSRFPEGRPLILAPRIILQSWENEFENWKVQEVPIYKISGSTRDTSPVDGGGSEADEDEEDARLPPHVRTSLKAGRVLTLRKWQKGRGVLLMSYTLFANLIKNGAGDNVRLESLDYQMSKVLRESTNLVILDEGHLARNVNTKISQALLALETKRRVLLSGTLFQNNLKELYTLLKLCRSDFMISHPQYGKKILENVASSSHRSSKYSNGIRCLEEKTKKDLLQIEKKIFMEEIGDRLEHYMKSGETRTDEIESVVLKLRSLTSSFVDRYPGEVLKSLPGLIEYSIHLNLTEDQHMTIKRLPNSDQVKCHMTRLNKTLAACIHPSLVHQGEEARRPLSQLSSSAWQSEAHKGVKITFVLRLMASCKLVGERLLIFCSTLGPLMYLEDCLYKMWGWLQGEQIMRLDGKMLESDRQKTIQMFNDKKSSSQVLLASTKACNEGITLVGASRVVILDNPENPSVVRQAVSRAFRIGQEKKVYVYRLVTTHESEEHNFTRSVSKERLSQLLLDPMSTMSKLGNFLQEQRASDIEDKLLQKLMLSDREYGRHINVVKKYNAAGS